MKEWSLFVALTLLISGCGGDASSEDASPADDGGDAASGGAGASGGAAAGGNATSGGAAQDSEYYIDVVLDGVQYSLKDNIIARPISSGFEFYAESESVGYGFYFSYPPDHLGVYECDEEVSFMSTRIEQVHWLDLLSPEGTCSVEFTEVGKVFRGTFSGELYQIVPNTPPQVVSAGRFYLPLE